MKKISDHFDCVIMITSSDWATEPRSNRFHFATRFAKQIPVYFLQFDQYNDQFIFEETEHENIIVVKSHASFAPCNVQFEQSLNLDKAAIRNFLEYVKARRALLWCYNPFAWKFTEMMQGIIDEQGYSSYTVYHASENYFSQSDNLKIGVSGDDGKDEFANMLKGFSLKLAELADSVFAVSDGVSESLIENGADASRTTIVPNGCDAEHWLGTRASDFNQDEQSERPRILYQGGINNRLDYKLIHGLIHRLPDWDFMFCGRELPDMAEWEMLKAHPNVFYLGELEIDEIAEVAKTCRIGIVPFLDEHVLRTSMPLKMFEYVACGLPVVSTPIKYLRGSDPELFTFAENDVAFEAAIRSLAPTRTNLKTVKKRRKAARNNGYDKRFSLVENIISSYFKHNMISKKNVIVLYDDKWSHIKTISEHLESFGKYSDSRIFYVPATIIDGKLGEGHYFKNDKCLSLGADGYSIWNFGIYDALVIHYSVRLSLKGYIPDTIFNKIQEYDGEKVLFIQDEYDEVNITRKNISDLGITTIFTCVPPEGHDKIYPRAQFPDLEFQQTLTGYVPEDPSIEAAVQPIELRRKLIGYRGRLLPHHYGALGFEKFDIGVRVREEAQKRELPVDIEWEAEKRIYGSWYEFLGSCRATLGTESGSNLFDFDGSLKQLAEKYADKPFEEVYEKHFKPHDDYVHMNQISPKFFEAIRLRTALICFPGTYSGILEAEKHFIVLNKDYSNIDEVFEKLQDLDFISELTERAHEDIIASGKNSYGEFIRGFDAWLDQKIEDTQVEIISAPIAVRRGKKITPLLHTSARDMILNSSVLNGDIQRENFADLFSSGASGSDGESGSGNTLITDNSGSGHLGANQPSQVPEHVVPPPRRPIFQSQQIGRRSLARRLIPTSVKRWVKSVATEAVVAQQHNVSTARFRFIRRCWHLVPVPLRQAIGRRVFPD